MLRNINTTSQLSLPLRHFPPRRQTLVQIPRNAMINPPERRIRRRPPHRRLLHHHLGRVKDPTVRRLIHKLQRRLRLIPLPDSVTRVDHVVRGAVEREVGVRAQHGGVVVGFGVLVVDLEGQFHAREDVAVGVVVGAFDAADGLDEVSVGAAAEGDAADAGLLLHEFAEDGAGAGVP